MWKTGSLVFPPKKGLVVGGASDQKTKMTCYKNANYPLWRPLIGKKPKEDEEYDLGQMCTVDTNLDNQRVKLNIS